jgi:hypothetical protein
MTEFRAPEVNSKIIAEFRANGGKVPGFAQYEAGAAPRRIAVVVLDPVK